LRCVAVRCSVLQCVAVCCSVLQCVAVRCSVLQCVAVCCGALQCVAVSQPATCIYMMCERPIAAHGSMLQCHTIQRVSM